MPKPCPDVGRFGQRGPAWLPLWIGARRAGVLRSPTCALHDERVSRARAQTFVFAVSTALRRTACYDVGSTGCPRVATRVLRDRGGLEGRAVETRRV